MYAYQQAQVEVPAPVEGIVEPNRSKAVLRYMKDDSLNLTPVQVIAKIYDVGIIACKKQDAELAKRAINELIVALNFEYQEVSLGLYRLYKYSKKCLREGKYNEAATVLEELRSAWVQAFHLGKPAVVE
jgi:flagellar secretion chaperone FliS